MKIYTTLFAAGLVAACGGKKDDKPAPAGDQGGATKPVEDQAAVPSGPFAEFGSNDDVLAKWQGAWVLESGSLGHFEAWEVKGTKVTSWDGQTEKTRELEIQAPCSARIVEKTADGSSGTTVTFVFEGDQLHTGMGDAGLKKGDKILACGSGKIFVWDGAACAAHEDMFGRWEHEPTECKLEGGTFTAKRPGMDMTSTLVVAGDVLMSEQMKGNKVEKAASFDDAKQKLAALKK